MADRPTLRRDLEVNRELLRLGLLGGVPSVLLATWSDTISQLEARFMYREAADIANEVVSAIDQLGAQPPVDLLRTAGERLHRVGEVNRAIRLAERALESLERQPAADPAPLGATLLSYARMLVQTGRPAEALPLLERALPLMPDRRTAAIVLGDIARIRVRQGEVAEGLKLHEEALKVYEELGDKRSRAITLGDIARIRVAQGEVAEGLKLHEEALKVYEELGDKHFRAVTLGDIARIRVRQGEVAEGLQLEQERLAANRDLKDQEGIANALWDISQIQLSQQDPEALRSLSESYQILLHIGRLDGICFVGLLLGQILCANGQAELGRPMLERSRDGFLQLDRHADAAEVQQALDECASQ